MRKLRIRALAGLLGISSMALGLAVLPASAVVTPDTDASGNVIPPEWPADGTIKALDAPNFTSFVALKDGAASLVKETDLGAMHNEFGTDDHHDVSTTDTDTITKLATVDAIPSGTPSPAVSAPVASAVGDLDGDGSPQVVSINGSTLLVSNNLDDGFQANSAKADHGTRRTASLSAGLETAQLNGEAIAPVRVGIVDGFTKADTRPGHQGEFLPAPENNRVWVVTDTGAVLLYKASTSNPAALDLATDSQSEVFYVNAPGPNNVHVGRSYPLVAPLSNEKVLDATSHSDIDQAPVDLDGELRDASAHRQGYIGILTARNDFAGVTEVRVKPDGTFDPQGGSGINSTELFGAFGNTSLFPNRGELHSDVVTLPNGEQRHAYAAFLVRPDQPGANGALLYQGSADSDSTVQGFCPSANDGPRDAHFAMQLVQAGMVVSCAADGGPGTTDRMVRVQDQVIPFGDGPTIPNVETVHNVLVAADGVSANSLVRSIYAPSTPLLFERTGIDMPCDWLLEISQQHSQAEGAPPTYDGACSTGSVFSQVGSPDAKQYDQADGFGRFSTYAFYQAEQGGAPAGAPAMVVVSRDGDDDEPGFTPPGTHGNLWDYTRTLTPNAATGSGGLQPATYDYLQLPATKNQLKVKLDKPNEPEIVQTKPIPLVVMQSPPYVNGAGQSPLAGPTYNVRATTGNSSGTSNTNSIGVSVGIDIEDPTGALGFNASVSVDESATNEIEHEIEVTTSEQFVGDPEEDTIVYQTPTVYRYPGTVVESANGLGTGTRTTVDVPRSILVSSGTQSHLQDAFPDLYATGSSGEGVLGRILTNTDGDPYTYPHWSDSIVGPGEPADISNGTSNALSTYCDGAHYNDLPSPDDSAPSYPFGLDEANPFIITDLVPNPLAGPGILNSDNHRVQVGQGTSEGAGFSITNTTTQSRISELTVGVDVGATAGFVTVDENVSHTWGESMSSSFSSGVDFLGYVGHLPTQLPNETYDYRLFLCKKQLGNDNAHKNGVPVWVFGYTVDNYHGSGGLEDLGDVALQSPIQSTLTTTNPTLDWNQETGTIKSYDVEVEGVGTPNQHYLQSDLFPITNSVDAKARDKHIVKTASDLGIPALLPNQLYRWRVTAHDLFENTTTSDWEFFKTLGPPQNVTIDDPGNVTTGVFQDFTVHHDDVGGPFTYRWEMGDGRVFDSASPPTVTGPTLHTKYDAPGVYQLKAIVRNAYGSTTALRTVIVGPQAHNESFTVVEDTPVPDTYNVLANDPGGELTQIVVPPTHAKSFHLNLDGTFTYVPQDNYCSSDANPATSPDTFTYSVRGGPSVKNATATINITCVNDAPVLDEVASPYDATEDTVLAEEAPGVLRTLSDVDFGQTYTASKKSNPTHGSVTVAANGGFTYTPTTNYCGDDSFTVQAKDNGTPNLNSNVLTVPITVACVNDAPKVVNQSKTVTEDDDTTSYAAPGVLTGSSDPDTGDTRTAVLVSGPTHGALTLNTDGSYSYKPDANYCNTGTGGTPDTFTFTAKDQGVPPPVMTSNVGTVSITVTCVNDAPTAVAKSYTTTEDTNLVVPAATGLVVGATDVDDTALTAEISTQPAHGTLTATDPNGSFTYKPASNYCGPDSFDFRTSDGHAASDHGRSAPVTATLAVTCVNDAPTVGADTFTGVTDAQSFAFTAAQLLANDSDVDGTLTVQPLANQATALGGSVSIDASGNGTYVSAPGAHGNDTVTYSVKDTTVPGSPTVNTVTGTITFKVKARTTLAAVKATHSGSKATVKATLVTIGGSHPAAGKTIRFVLSSGAAFCTATTDANGVATCTETSPPAFILAGRYTAAFDGDAEYHPSMSPSTPFGLLVNN